jgi:hypothetical protein
MQSTDQPLLEPDEEAILAAIGYLVMRWNYAENFARQILRMYCNEGTLFSKGHQKISGQSAGGIEQDLEKIALPNWGHPGFEYLERLIEVYASGRNHRNNIVHGIHSTSPQRGKWPAQAIMVYAKPQAGKLFIPTNIDLHELKNVAHHFHDIAMFARDVAICFNKDGSVAENPDGSAVLPSLPTMILPLPAVQRFEI